MEIFLGWGCGGVVVGRKTRILWRKLETKELRDVFCEALGVLDRVDEVLRPDICIRSSFNYDSGQPYFSYYECLHFPIRHKSSALLPPLG